MGMIKDFIAKNISYQLQDFFNNTSILKTYQFLNQSQSWERNRIISYQFEKFQKLLHHSYNNVYYYRELFNKEKLNVKDIKNPEDISKIPILTKKIVREQNNKLITNGLNPKTVLTIVTGGTTGPPLKILRDKQDSSFTWGAFFRWYNWMGVQIGDRITKIWGTPTVIKKPFKQYFWGAVKNYYYNRQHINSFNLNQKTIPGILNRINKFKPVLIRGYLSALIQLAEYIQDENIIDFHRPRAISSTTETLFPSLRVLIERIFKTKLYDQYGCGECNSIAFDNNDGNGLYIAMEHAMVEILDNQNDDAGYSEGRLIVTNLDNYAMPFIRYENGDLACRGRKENKSDFNLDLLKRISGRMADTIILNDGSKVHGVFFTDILNDLFTAHPDFIHRFQVYQNIPGKIDFRIETTEPLQDNYKELIHESLNLYFKEVTISPQPVLANDKSGKFRYIVSDLPCL